MKKIIFLFLFTLFTHLIPSNNINIYLINFLSPVILFSRSIHQELVSFNQFVSNFSSIRDENFQLKNREFVLLNKEYELEIMNTLMSEMDSLIKIMENTEVVKGKSYFISKILYIDRNESKMIVEKKEGSDIKVGDPVLIGNNLVGLIVVENTTSYEVELWNKKGKNINTIVIGSENQRIVTNTVTENFNTSYIENILSTEDVRPGDIVVTASTNTNVPSNLVIGIVDRVEGVSSQTFRKAFIRKQYNIENRNYVVLLRNNQ